MLFKNDGLQLVRIPDGDGGTPPTPPPATGEGTTTTSTTTASTPPATDNGNGTGLLTQEQVSELVGTTRTKARATGRDKTLEELGFKSLEDAQAALQRWREIEDKDKTELQKAQERLEQLSHLEETATQQSKLVETYETAVTAQVDALKKTLNIPDYVVSLLDEMTPVQQLQYITKHQESFTQPAKPPKPNINGGDGSSGKPPADPEKRKEVLTKRYPSLRK